MDQQMQLALAVGAIVSLAVQWLKRVWPRFDCSDATVKQVAAVCAAALAVYAASGWQLSNDVLINMAIAAFAALATHRALLQQPAQEE